MKHLKCHAINLFLISERKCNYVKITFLCNNCTRFDLNSIDQLRFFKLDQLAKYHTLVT